MKVLITAGGTSEDLDNVRTITNRSTGRLGSIIADTFADKGAPVTYLCGERAARPKNTDVDIVEIRGVRCLAQEMRLLLNEHKFDCVIHSMAVSDFTPRGVVTLDDVVECVSKTSLFDSHEERIQKTKESIASLVSGRRENKISSKNSDLMIVLEKTPKVISMIKDIQPETVLVGFKLLSGVSETELLKAAERLMVDNSCDFVLANDLDNISQDEHEGILLSKSGAISRASTKQEIARIIYRKVSEEVIR